MTDPTKAESPVPDAEPGPGTEPAQTNDDLKEKYRAALAAKHPHEESGGKGGKSNTGPGSAGGGSAHTQRMFRRKSGG